MNESVLLYIWLSMAFPYGSPYPKKLLLYFENEIKRIYQAEKEDYREAGIPLEKVDLLEEKNLDNAKRALAYCVTEKIGIVTFSDRLYPERLRIIQNPPVLLYFRGKLEKLDDHLCIATVGTRTCTKRGYDVAYFLSFGMAKRGAVLVSGLALGIDAACTKGALDAGGYAVGVLGCGIDCIYPNENKSLFYEMSEKGLILTEFPPFTKPSGRNFPIRNRIISGISLATAVMEADATSGALITAKHALAQGRKIFAVPGNVGDGAYTGSNELIKDGAFLFTSADDIIDEYALLFPHRIKDDTYDEQFHLPKEYHMKAGRKKEVPKTTVKVAPLKVSAPLSDEIKPAVDLSMLTDFERNLYELFPSNPISADEMSIYGHQIADVLTAFTMLELHGLIVSLPGGMFQKAIE